MKPLTREASWASYADLFDGQPPTKPSVEEDFDFDFDNDLPSPSTAPASHNPDPEARWMNGEISMDELRDLQAAEENTEVSVGPLSPSFASANAHPSPGVGAASMPPYLPPSMTIHSGQALAPFNQHLLPFPIQLCGMMVPLVPYYGPIMFLHPTQHNIPLPGSARIPAPLDVDAFPGAPYYWSTARVDTWNSGVPTGAQNLDKSATNCDTGLGDKEGDDDEFDSTMASDSECSNPGSTATATSDDPTPASCAESKEARKSKDWAYSHCALEPDDWALRCPICVHELNLPEDEYTEEHFFTRDEFVIHIANTHIDPSASIWACPLPLKTSQGVTMQCRGQIEVRTNSTGAKLNTVTPWNILRHICGTKSHGPLLFGFTVGREADGTWFQEGDAGPMPDLQCKYCPETFSRLWIRDGKLGTHINQEHPE